MQSVFSLRQDATNRSHSNKPLVFSITELVPSYYEFLILLRPGNVSWLNEKHQSFNRAHDAQPHSRRETHSSNAPASKRLTPHIHFKLLPLGQQLLFYKPRMPRSGNSDKPLSCPWTWRGRRGRCGTFESTFWENQDWQCSGNHRWDR